MDFLALKQGNSTITEYAAKFVELVKFYLDYGAKTTEFSKCIKFENGLCLEVKRVIGYQQICRFVELVKKCQIYEEDNITHSAHYKSLNEKRGKLHHNHKKPYDAPADKRKQKVAEGKKTSGGGDPATVICYRCGGQGHRSNECENKVLRCYRYSKKHNLIRGACFINNAELVAIIDTAATHSFILLDCATMLGLKLSSMEGSMVMDTPASGFVTNTFVCKGCPLTIFDKSFVMDFVCIPLHQIDVIFGMNWLEFNYVHINCYNKTLRFPKFCDNGELLLLMLSK
ncbi:uncharacterized protein LOC131598192 [Vicia villosa]|uniref:uncharacterized protein LOC131598192 n=1 Tax=Vicia villosa TaxID=3911 RepID=UPI00273AD781|nr:uncharacterized protein LOC131598192 [Vicia villosa]